MGSRVWAVWAVGGDATPQKTGEGRKSPRPLRFRGSCRRPGAPNWSPS